MEIRSSNITFGELLPLISPDSKIAVDTVYSDGYGHRVKLFETDFDHIGNANASILVPLLPLKAITVIHCSQGIVIVLKS